MASQFNRGDAKGVEQAPIPTLCAPPVPAGSSRRARTPAGPRRRSFGLSPGMCFGNQWRVDPAVYSVPGSRATI